MTVSKAHSRSKLRSSRSSQRREIVENFDELVPEGHHKNALRQQFLLQIKMNLVKDLSDQSNAIAKGQTSAQRKHDKLMMNSIARSASHK